MKKRASRRARARKERRLSRRSGYIVAALLVIIGILGAVFSGQRYREYQKSDDVRTVQATVLDVDTATKKDENGFRQTVWKTHLQYEVNGKTYKDSAVFETEVKVGGVEEIEVYRTPRGAYRIPRTSESRIARALFIGIALIGVLTAGLCTFVFAEPARPRKKRRENQNNERGTSD